MCCPVNCINDCNGGEGPIVLLKLHSRNKQTRRRKRDAVIVSGRYASEDENILRDVVATGDNRFNDSSIIIALQYCHARCNADARRYEERNGDSGGGSNSSCRSNGNSGNKRDTRVYSSFSGCKLVIPSDQGSPLDGCNLSDNLINLRASV